MHNFTAKRLLLAATAALAVFAAGVMTGANKFGTPSTVLHVITVQWKADSTPAQRQAALDGVKKMAAEVPGLKNVWLKTLKVQPGDYNAAFVMEFASRAAFDAYAKHPAHSAWEKVYLPVRQESRTSYITN